MRYINAVLVILAVYHVPLVSVFLLVNIPIRLGVESIFEQLGTKTVFIIVVIIIIFVFIVIIITIINILMSML